MIMLPSCSKKEYEVSFLGFDNEIIEQIKVRKKDKITYPNEPTVEGYDFVGWDQQIEYTKKDIVIKANYQIKKFTVKFFDELGNLLETKTVSYNQSIDYQYTFNKEGYFFVKWDQNLNNIKSNLEVKPVFSESKYTVKFYNELNSIIKEEVVSYGSSVTAPADLVKEGYKFIGWNTSFDNVTSDLNVYPVFEALKYKVCFYYEDGNLLTEQYVEYGRHAIAPADLVKEGYKFIGWNTSFDNVKSELEIYPIFEILQYKVRFFDENDNLLKEELVNYGSKATAPDDLIKEGCYFIGWDKSFDNVTSDLDIYPVYNTTNYTVTFIGMYGDVLKTETVNYNESATAPSAPLIDYYNFVQWDKTFDKVTSNLTIQAVYSKKQQSYDISNPNYWLQILSSEYDIKKTILDQTQIKNYNEQILSDYVKTEVIDVLGIKGTKTQIYVKNLIEAYNNINKYTVYNNDTKTSLSSTEKTAILNNRNLSSIPSIVTIKYGIITDFGWLRSYPTNHYSSTYTMDRFQETSLNVGEGVAIYHESTDKNWYFVQAENYNGWIEKKYVAECSYEVLESFLKPSNNLIIISDYVNIENAFVRMGQSFPLISKEDNSYTIKFPTRNSEGMLELKDLVLAKSDSYHEGYLEYNYYNIFIQGFKLLGIDYSWGDKDRYGRDCSSTMNAIYKCFGFMMARNTSNQVATPTYGIKLNGLTNASIQNYKPGTMIYTSGHVMLYIGEDANGVAYLLHNTTAGNGACILQSLNSFGGSRIIGILRFQ